MNVRWTAVLTGFGVDFLIAILLSPFLSETILTSPDLTRPGDVILLSLPIVLTTVSGYVAGRVAKTSRVLNGCSCIIPLAGREHPQRRAIRDGVSMTAAAVAIGAV